MSKLSKEKLEDKCRKVLHNHDFNIGDKLPNGHIPFKKGEVDLSFGIGVYADGSPYIEVFDENIEGDDLRKSQGRYQDDVENFVKHYDGRRAYYNKELDRTIYACSQEEADKIFKSVSKMDAMMAEQMRQAKEQGLI